MQGVEEEAALRRCHKMRCLSNGPCVFVVFKDAVTRSGASGPENVPKPPRLCIKVAVQDRSEELTTRRARPVGEGLGRGRSIMCPNIMYPPGLEPKAFGGHEPSDIRILRLKGK